MLKRLIGKVTEAAAARKEKAVSAASFARPVVVESRRGGFQYWDKGRFALIPADHSYGEWEILPAKIKKWTGPDGVAPVTDLEKENMLYRVAEYVQEKRLKYTMRVGNVNYPLVPKRTQN